MADREPVEVTHYVAITATWYLATLIAGGAAALAVSALHDPRDSSFLLGAEIVGAFIMVTGIIAPAVVGLVLRHLGDPAMGMTVSALVMLGHIMILSGPLFLATPVVARYLAVQRHNSGGF